MARRVNKKFLTILSLIIMGTLLSLAALHLFRKKGDTKLLWQRVDQQMALAREQNTLEAYVRAKDAFGKALRADPNNIEGIVKYGDLIHEMIRFDETEVWNDVRAWEKSLQIDPRYVPALERLVDAYMELCRLQPEPEAFRHLRERAATLARIQPENARAEAFEQIGIIGSWLYGSPTRETEIELSVAKLVDLAKKKPDELEIPSYIAHANLRLANNRDSERNEDAAKTLRNQAIAVFEEAMKAQPQNAGLAYRYFQMHARMVDPKLEGEEELKERTRLQALLDHAISLVKPTDPDYVDIKMAAARGKGREGEKMVEDLLKERPNDQRVRMVMANIWRTQPEKRQQAIELLSQPIGDDSARTGFRALRLRELNFYRLIELAEVQILTWQDTPAAERPALREAIDATYKSALAIYADENRPHLLKLKGKILLLDQNRESLLAAIRVMRQAHDKLEQHKLLDAELTDQLARLYYMIGETGQFRTLTSKLLEARPNHHQGRRQLITLLLRERLWEEAKKHIDVLEKHLKDDPDTARLKVAYLLGTGDLANVKAMIGSMSENTPSQKLVKATCYQVVGENEKAENLLVPLSANEAVKNYEESVASQMLARLYMKNDRKQDAAKFAQEVLNKKPKDRFFQVLQLAAQDKATPEQMSLLHEGMVDGIADPVAREVERYWLHRQQNKPVAELEAPLVALGKQHPNNPVVLETLFNHGIDFGNFTLASNAADALGRMNYDQAEGLYYRARIQLARREGEAALETATELARRLPEFSRTWVLMGQAQQLNGQYESAVASFNKALEMQLENFDALRGLVECHIELRQISVAKQFLARGAKTQNPGFFIEVGKRLQEMTGDPKAVTAAREEDLKSKPEVLGVHLALIDNYFRVAEAVAKTDAKAAQEYLAKAESHLKNALQKWPDESGIYHRLSEVQVRAKKPADGLKVLQEFAARDKWKDKPEPQLMLASYYQSLPIDRNADNAGEVYTRNMQNAEAALQTARSKAPGNNAVGARLVDFYLQTNQGEKALTLLSDLVRTSNDSSLRQRLIELQVTAGQLKEAEQTLQLALQNRPEDHRLLALMGFVRMSAKDPRSASDYFDRAIKAKSDYATAFYWRGINKNSSGDSNGALADFEQARNLQPSNVDFHVALADLHAARNMGDEVVQGLEAALTLAPYRNDLRARLLQVHLDRKQWTSAEKILAEVKQNPDLSKNPVWWKLESQMWQLREDPLKAIDAIQQALTLNPSDQDSIQNLLKILIDSRQPKAYQQVIVLTDSFFKREQARPWWIFNARAVALASLGQKDQAAKEYDLALSAIDASARPVVQVDAKTGQPVRMPTEQQIAAADEFANATANMLVRSMVQHIGPQATEAKLKDRAAPRWDIELTQVYMAQKDWSKLVAHLDALHAADRYNKLRNHQQMQVLRVSGQAYPAASGSIPGTYEKGILYCQKYITELEKMNAPAFTKIEALNNLASLIAENPNGANPTQAMQYSKRAFEIMGESGAFSPHVADTHGWILVLCGQLEDGIDVLKRATDPKETRIPAEAYYHLGEAYLKKSLTDDALQNFERAVQVYDESVKKGVFVDPDLKNKATAAIARAKNKTAAAAGIQ